MDKLNENDKLIENKEKPRNVIRLNQNTTRTHIALTEDITEIEYCSHDSEIGILLIGPDPNWGGNMNTPVIDKLFKSFDEQEISTMRFSFTKYQIFNNNYDKYITQAAVCLEEFFRVVDNLKRVWLIGYSFGSLVGLNLALRRPDVQGVIMLSPPILNYDFISWFMAFNAKVLVVYGTRDHLIPQNIMDAYIKYLAINKVQVSMCPILGSNHYLTGKEDQIARECLSFIFQSPEAEESF